MHKTWTTKTIYYIAKANTQTNRTMDFTEETIHENHICPTEHDLITK